jgi:arylsulfatase A-like enzyme
MKQTAGTHTRQLTELVDVLPTLVELGGLTLPTNEVRGIE